MAGRFVSGRFNIGNMMRTLSMTELSAVAGGESRGVDEIIFPTVTILYDTGTGGTYYNYEGSGMGWFVNNDINSVGGGGGGWGMKDQIEAELQLATAVLGTGALLTAIPFPAVSAVFGLGAIATAAAAFAVSKYPQP